MINLILKNILFKSRPHMSKGFKVFFVLGTILGITLVGMLTLNTYYDKTENCDTKNPMVIPNDVKCAGEQNNIPLSYIAEDTAVDDYTPKDKEIKMLARLIWGEARGVKSITKRSAVVWCVLNRVDASGFPNTIADVVLQPNQFVGYNEQHPVTNENAIIAHDVLMRWHSEKYGCTNSGRTLPSDYKYFTGDGKENYFTKDWNSSDKWNWSCISPYEN